MNRKWMGLPRRFWPGMLLLIIGCETVQAPPFPEPLRPPSPRTSQTSSTSDEQAGEEQGGPIFGRAPPLNIDVGDTAGQADAIGANLKGKPIAVTFNEVPLVTFINEVFGSELGLSYVISGDLRSSQALVTLRLTKALPPDQLFRTARNVLSEYGVGITEQDGLLTFSSSDQGITSEVPLLVSGRTLPDVPVSHRIIFQRVPLHVVQNAQVRVFLKQALPNDLEVLDEPSHNAVLLKGRIEMIEQALSIIEVLDQPVLRSKYNLIIEPEYLTPRELAETLDKVLRAEGYEPSMAPPVGSFILLPLEQIGKLLVFAGAERVLEHIKVWSRELDIQKRDRTDDGIFRYQLQNVAAEQIIDTVGQLAGGVSGRSSAPGSGSAAAPESSDGGASGGQSSGSSQAATSVGGLVVDRNRNLLLFRGTGKEWGQLRPVIEELDQAVPSVLIEVLVAEITLTDRQGSGFEFLFTGGLGRYSTSGGTRPSDSSNLGARGLSLVLDSAGATRAALNLFYDDRRIVIRSSPKLLVRSGASATIEVGNEIPVITQLLQDSTQTSGTTNVLQDIAYRKTGVVMTVTPLVQANGLVDLEISHVLSEAQSTDSATLTPTILRRSVNTSLTLKDGGSLLMGGIIANNQSGSNVGVPGLARLPGVGRLFRRESLNQDRVELIIMVIPYVIADHQEGWDLTDAFRRRLEIHDSMGAPIEPEPLQ